MRHKKRRLLKHLPVISFTIISFVLTVNTAAFAFWEDSEGTDQFTRTTDDGATIGLNVYTSTKEEGTVIKPEPVVLIHGWNSDGSIWKNSQANYVGLLREEGYDVIVVDTRRNVEDAADLGPRGWLYGFENSAYDVKAAISEALEWYNETLPIIDPDAVKRNYTQVKAITHSDGFTKVSEYTRSSFYQDDIKEIYSLNPPVFGTNGYIALGKNFVLPWEVYITLKDGKIKKPGSSGYESLWETQQVMFKSDYMRTKGSFGPQENIPIYISVFENDNVVDPLYQFLWRRLDEAIYEYFKGGHYGYTNKDALLAIIDKLNHGPYSAYFNKKPYALYAMFVGEEFLKQRYPNLTSPANDHPDDTYDVSTASLDVDILLYDFLSYYNRLAIKKHKAFFPRYCQNLDLFRQAQDAYDNLPAGISDEQFLAEWEDMLSQANAYNEQNANLVKDDLNNLPDVAILFQGYYAQAAKLALEKFQEPVRIVTVDFSHSYPLRRSIRLRLIRYFQGQTGRICQGRSNKVTHTI